MRKMDAIWKASKREQQPGYCLEQNYYTKNKYILS